MYVLYNNGKKLSDNLSVFYQILTESYLNHYYIVYLLIKKFIFCTF